MLKSKVITASHDRLEGELSGWLDMNDEEIYEVVAMTQSESIHPDHVPQEQTITLTILYRTT